MLEDLTRKPSLEWLLTPAARPPSGAAAAKPVDDGFNAVITLDRVMHPAGGIAFHQPAAGFPGTLGVTSTAYRPPEGGGTQRAALAEMTGYLGTRLQPSPGKP